MTLIRRWLLFLLLGAIAFSFPFEEYFWPPGTQNIRFIIISCAVCLIAGEMFWKRRLEAFPLLLFFVYTALMLLIMLGGQNTPETAPLINLFLSLSIPIATYAVSPFESTFQWLKLCAVLFILFGGYGFYLYHFGEPQVSPPTFMIFWMGYVLFFTLVIRSQPYMQPQMRPLLMAARYFAVGLVPIIVTQVIPIWWLGEPLITGDFVYFCVVFTGLGFATLNSPDYSSFTNTIDKRMVAIMSALIIHILYSYGRTFNIPFLSDLLLIVLIVVGILRSGLWQQKIIKDVFGQGELSADFMQSAANQLAPSTYERIRQVTLEAADALNVAHVVLLVEDGQREWRTIVSDESISTNAWPEWLLYEVQETKWFDGVHPLSGLPDWIRLAVPLHGIDAPQGYLILSSPRDTAQFHTHQRSQIETFSNLLLNAIQTASVKQQEAFFVDELMRVDADTRQEIGTRIHAELLDKISALSREPALQTGVPQQLLSEIASSARDIMDQVYPIDYSQNVYDVVMATVTLCQTADVDIELNRPNLADCHLPEAQRRSVSMVLQEALANALKHAKPTYISTTVAAACGELTISVRDNGQASVTYHPGHGLRSIRHWVEAHGGTYHITPNPNGGTFFFCTMNYDPL